MSGIDWTGLTPSERLVAEQAVRNLRALSAACDAAPDGQVLGVAEKLVIEQGREAIRRALEITLQSQDAEVEKKARRAGPVRVD
jgi:hypothetical protein